ncbi:MAG: metallophosphoesterase [Bacteroidales bacterium]|nr:metallophosphoesterase [Bacteroidales bacterium]
MKRTAVLVFAALLLFAGCSQTPKVDYKVWYDWPERYLPEFNKIGEPAVQGVKTNIDLVDIDDTKDHFCVLFETTLKVRTEEEYNFTLTTDDGSRLYIDGELLIVNDGAHGPIEKKCSKVLSKGKHPIRIEFFDFDKGQSLVFRYSTPTIADRELNDKVLEKEDRASDRHGFVKPQVKEAYARFAEWKGDDEVVVFPILTDIHTAGRFSYKHIGYAKKAAYKFGADFMALLGDIGLNSYPATIDASYAREILNNTRNQMQKYDGIWIYAPGNHDWDGGEGEALSEEFLSDFFQKPWEEKAGGNLHLTPGKTYGYLDIPAKNFRVVFLNSEATGTKGTYYIFGEEQLEWLASVFEETPAETQVLLVCHWMPHPLGVWNAVSMNPVRKEPSSVMMDFLASWAEKVNIVGLFTGDAHVNFHRVDRGVNYYVTQGYGWVSPDLMLPGQKHAFFNYLESLCIDMIAVKPATREVHTFRIGAGGAEYDSEFGY